MSISLPVVPSKMLKQKTSSTVTKGVGFDPIYSQHIKAFQASACLVFILDIAKIRVNPR